MRTKSVNLEAALARCDDIERATADAPRSTEDGEVTASEGHVLDVPASLIRNWPVHKNGPDPSTLVTEMPPTSCGTRRNLEVRRKSCQDLDGSSGILGAVFYVDKADSRRACSRVGGLYNKLTGNGAF